MYILVIEKVATTFTCIFVIENWYLSYKYFTNRETRKYCGCISMTEKGKVFIGVFHLISVKYKII